MLSSIPSLGSHDGARDYQPLISPYEMQLDNIVKQGCFLREPKKLVQACTETLKVQKASSIQSYT